MDLKDGIQTFYPPTQIAWREWLQKHHETEKAVWLIYYKRGSGVPSIDWGQAVEEALCFGWIDSKAVKRDKESYYQFYCPRKPKSGWSKKNKETVTRLINEGRMEPAGMAAIELAKKTGTWNALDEIEACIVPEDLQAALDHNPAALTHWTAFPPSSKKIILYWVMSAKRAETREKRIRETVELAAQNIRANHYRP